MNLQSETDKIALVVESDDATRELLATLLRNQATRVVAVPDVKSALRVMSRIVPSIITLDLSMADLSGREVLDELSRRGLSAQVPVIVISTESHCLPPALLARVFRAIEKPFELDDVIETAQAALRSATPAVV